VRLLRLAADGGCARAQCALGVRHQVWDVWVLVQSLSESLTGLHVCARTQNGLGVPEDAREAGRLYRMAASKGEPSALFNLAIYHDFGLGGVAKNPREAIRLYKLSADKGYGACASLVLCRRC
jgi:TPR repeat protein